MSETVDLHDVYNLDVAGLLMLRETIDARLLGLGEQPPGGQGLAVRPWRAWVEIHLVNKRPYAYLRWRENGKKRSRYLGRVAKADPLRG